MPRDRFETEKPIMKSENFANLGNGRALKVFQELTKSKFSLVDAHLDGAAIFEKVSTGQSRVSKDDDSGKQASAASLNPQSFPESTG
jgi:hypothetical protein